ncbi:MAG: hypothetical protein M0R32_11795 [Candidatus Cloacimonetes bacterium]|jgi:hypothetical protein|nr:hypothetical protein [Candidatus Cloacimonadota bacterium]
MQEWKNKLTQLVISKIDELIDRGTVDIGFDSFISLIDPPKEGGPFENAPKYGLKKVAKEYRDALSDIIEKLPEPYYGFIYHKSHSGMGFEPYKKEEGF